MKKTETSAAITAAPAALVVVGEVGGLSVTAPNLSSVTSAAEQQIVMWESYKGTIDNEEVKFFVNNELVKIKQQQKKWEAELKKITDPLLESRRQALAAKQAAENLFARLFGFLGTGERLLKNEILRYEGEVERKRLEAEAVLRRRAEAEQRRLEEEARLQAEAAAQKNLEEQQLAAALDLAGKGDEAARLRVEADAELEASAEQVQATLEEAERTADSAILPNTSVKMKGTSVTGKWSAVVVDVMEVFAGIVDKSTPFDAVRVRVTGRLIPVPNGSIEALKLEGIEINMPYFNEQARKQEGQFNYRGMKSVFVRDLRVSA